MSGWQIVLIVGFVIFILFSWISSAYDREKENQKEKENLKDNIKILERKIQQPEISKIKPIKLIKVVFNGVVDPQIQLDTIKRIHEYIYKYGIAPEDNSYEITTVEYTPIIHNVVFLSKEK